MVKVSVYAVVHTYTQFDLYIFLFLFYNFKRAITFSMHSSFFFFCGLRSNTHRHTLHDIFGVGNRVFFFFPSLTVAGAPKRVLQHFNTVLGRIHVVA